MDLSRTGAIAVVLALGVMGPVGAGEVRGTIRLTSSVPAPEPVKVEAGTKAARAAEECGNLPRVSPKLIVDASGGVQNAVIWLEGSFERTYDGATDAVAIMDQQGCAFNPHVLIVPQGSALSVRNSDGVIHNVRLFLDSELLWREWQKPRAAELTRQLDVPGRYVMRCGVHPWMYAWVIAAEHEQYTVSDSAGRFTLARVPPGEHRLHVWHETLGERVETLRVGDDQAVVTVSFHQD